MPVAVYWTDAGEKHYKVLCAAFKKIIKIGVHRAVWVYRLSVTLILHSTHCATALYTLLAFLPILAATLVSRDGVASYFFGRLWSWLVIKTHRVRVVIGAPIETANIMGLTQGVMWSISWAAKKP